MEAYILRPLRYSYKVFGLDEFTAIMNFKHPNYCPGHNVIVLYGSNQDGPTGSLGGLCKRAGMECIGCYPSGGPTAWIWKYGDVNKKKRTRKKETKPQ